MIHQNLDRAVGIPVYGGTHDRLVLVELVAARIGYPDSKLAKGKD